jgi:outer membrane protein OmpA-like peptidoglycan-associated protein
MKKKISSPSATTASKANKATNAATVILLFGASIVTPALAQTAAVAPDAGKPVPGAALRYVGGDTRIGIGWDSDVDARVELFQVFQSSDTSATMGEIWGAKRAGGVKVSHNWANGGKTAANKVFAAIDQDAGSLRKFTLGGGQEYQNWFWTSSISKGISGDKLLSAKTSSRTDTINGVEAGRNFTQDVTTNVLSQAYQRAYDWGVGARVGHFYEGPLLRLTAGLDYEFGKARGNSSCIATPLSTCAPFSAAKPTQLTASLMAEKYFQGSGFSVALSGEVNRKRGSFELDRNDSRGLLMLRYEFGAPASNFRPSKIARTVTSTERVPDPNWVAPLAAAPTPAPAPAPAAAPTFRTEKQMSRADSRDEQESYFDLGSAVLKVTAKAELDALVARINAQKPYVEIRVNIIGHTCPTGSDRNNIPLSQKRADAVKAYLISKGIAANIISTDAKAGKAPKYPEVKGQSFRNRRADTEVIIVKEASKDVQVEVPGAPVAPPAAVATPVAPPATAPMIERTTSREVIEDVPNPWLTRALRSSVPHKTSVDAYRWVNTTSTQTLGAKVFANRGPVAVNDTYSVACEAPTTFTVLTNDTDADGDPISIASVTQPTRGTVVISGRNVIYTPTPGSCGGADSFTYTITDGKATSTATVNVAVAAPVVVINNKAPIAVDDAYVLGCRENSVLTVLRNDSDPDSDPLTITAVTQPAVGSVAISSDGKSINFTAPANCFKRMNFTYTISDGKGGTATASVVLIDP